MLTNLETCATKLLTAHLAAPAPAAAGHRDNVTSRRRHRLNVRIAASCLASLFLLACIPAASSAPASSSSKGLPRMDARRTDRLLEESQRKRLHQKDEAAASLATRCRSCHRLRTIGLDVEHVLLNAKDITSPPTAQGHLLRRTLRLCKSLTYQQYRFACSRSDSGPTAPAATLTAEPQHDDRLVTSQSVGDLAAVTSPLRSKLLSRRRRFLPAGDRRRRRLFSKTGYLLQILPNGKIRGTQRKTQHTIIEIQSVAAGGVVRFVSPATGMFLAMSTKGILFGSHRYIPEQCDFVEEPLDNHQSTYHSLALPRRNPGGKKWFVALGRHGQPRKGSRTAQWRDSAQFLPLDF